MFTKGSSSTWLMTLGTKFETKGEEKTNEEIFSEQLAQTIAQLLGYDFIADHPVADAFLFEPLLKSTAAK